MDEAQLAETLLKDLRFGLLRLHKVLLDWERSGYERISEKTPPMRNDVDAVFAHRDLLKLIKDWYARCS